MEVRSFAPDADPCIRRFFVRWTQTLCIRRLVFVELAEIILQSTLLQIPDSLNNRFSA